MGKEYLCIPLMAVSLLDKKQYKNYVYLRSPVRAEAFDYKMQATHLKRHCKGWWPHLVSWHTCLQRVFSALFSTDWYIRCIFDSNMSSAPSQRFAVEFEMQSLSITMSTSDWTHLKGNMDTFSELFSSWRMPFRNRQWRFTSKKRPVGSPVLIFGLLGVSIKRK